MIGIHNKIWDKQCNIFADFENLVATGNENSPRFVLNKSLYLKTKFSDLCRMYFVNIARRIKNSTVFDSSREVTSYECTDSFQFEIIHEFCQL